MLKQDTPLPENLEANKSNGPGTEKNHGSSSAPAETAAEMSHGQESYPGTRSGGEEDKPAQAPEAGDVDPGSTNAAESAGQGGKLGQVPPASGNPWNG